MSKEDYDNALKQNVQPRVELCKKHKNVDECYGFSTIVRDLDFCKEPSMSQFGTEVCLKALCKNLGPAQALGNFEGSPYYQTLCFVPDRDERKCSDLKPEESFCEDQETFCEMFARRFSITGCANLKPDPEKISHTFCIQEWVKSRSPKVAKSACKSNLKYVHISQSSRSVFCTTFCAEDTPIMKDKPAIPPNPAIPGAELSCEKQRECLERCENHFHLPKGGISTRTGLDADEKRKNILIDIVRQMEEYVSSAEIHRFVKCYPNLEKEFF